MDTAMKAFFPSSPATSIALNKNLPDELIFGRSENEQTATARPTITGEMN
jgi:hypothetical protein